MKYFGERSLSSFMSKFLHGLWICVLVATILAPPAAVGIIYLSTPSGTQFMQDAAQGKLHCWNGKAVKPKEGGKAGFGCWGADATDSSDMQMEGKDKRDWERFKSTPLALKMLILPYMLAVLVLLLLILRRSRQLFLNFKGNLLFNADNVALISKISKLLIAFSIITFSFSSFLLSVILLMVCEIIKTGATLQEEHDLTI
jgi:hypothetical protein